MEITTNAPKTNRSLTVEYDLGGSLDAAVALFGADVVYSKFEDSEVIAIQGLVRRYLEKTGDKYVDDETIRGLVAQHKPGIGPRRVDPIEALIARFGKMSPEKQAELLAKLKGE